MQFYKSENRWWKYDLDDPSVGVSKSYIEEGLQINKNLSIKKIIKTKKSKKCCN